MGQDNNKRALHFSDQLRAIAERYNGANPQVYVGISTLVESIRGGFSIESRVTPNGFDWGRRSLIDAFIKIYDPVLNKLFPVKSNVREAMVAALVGLPLAQHFIREKNTRQIDGITYLNLKKAPQLKYRAVADKLNIAATSLESRSSESLDAIELFKASQSLRILANTLYLIDEQLPKKLKFCKYCFRRAHSSRMYCDIHHSYIYEYSDASETTIDIYSNAEYRQFAKVPKADLKILRQRFEHCMFIQQAILDSVDISSVTLDESIEKLLSDLSSISSKTALVNLCKETKRGVWSVLADRWLALIIADFPLLASMLDDEIFDSSHWEDFIRRIRTVNENRYELELNPIFVICELSMTEKWLSYERTSRKPKKKHQIIELHQSKMEVVQIAVKLAVSKTYVHRIVADFNKT